MSEGEVDWWVNGPSHVENMAPVSKLLKSMYSPAIIRSRKHAGIGGRDEIGSGLDTVGALGLIRVLVTELEKQRQNLGKLVVLLR